MSLSQGLWSDSAMVLSSTLSVLLLTVTAVAVRWASVRGLTPRNSLLVPVVVAVAQAAFLAVVDPGAFYWLFVGTSVAVGAAVSLGVSVRHARTGYAAVSVLLVSGGIALATLWSTVELGWVLALVGLLGVVGFVVGYRVSSPPGGAHPSSGALA